MYYHSTRSATGRTSSAQAIARGLCADGGLFVPEQFPAIGAAAFGEMEREPYERRAERILSAFLTDFTTEEIRESISKAYCSEKFPEGPAPLALASGGISFLELWHGPTCAFKDMALQLLPQLLTCSLRKTGAGKDALILVATSGDTGKAAMEGFRDVPGTRILVFYPKDGVSPVQERQMCTQEGNNVCVCAVEGNFDDAQTGVKRIFGDEAIRARI